MSVCPNCSADNYDGALQCAYCGTSLEGSVLMRKKSSNKLPIIVIGVLLVILAIVIFNLNPEEKPIKNLLEAYNEADAKYAVEAFPDGYGEKLNEVGYFDVFQYYNPDYQSKHPFKYKVKDKKELGEEELRNIEYFLSGMYHRYNIEEKREVTAGYEIETEVFRKGQEGEAREFVFYVYKVNGKWCLLTIPKGYL